MKNTSGFDDEIQLHREFMKSTSLMDEKESDQQKRLPQPPLTKPAAGGEVIPLTKDFSQVIKSADYYTLLLERKSSRIYKNESLTLQQLAFLLWSTQGIQSIKGNNYATLRPVPSAGARHAFETYLAVLNVEGLEQGVYHYLPMDHSLEFLSPVDDLEDEVVKCLSGQKWAGKSAAVFFYSAVPYRSEWRYSTGAHKVMLIDVGHVVQNLYLSCHAIGCGTCAIAAYDQEESDRLMKLDGENEFIIYAAPVGVI